MKAPDKIYIQTNAGETISSKWTTIPFRDFENTEYISKNTLIEWASNMLGQVSDMGFDDGDVEHGYTRALQDVIEHLKKM